MPVCTTGTQKVDLPSGQLVIVNASVQSSGNQTVTIKDSGGNTVSKGSGRSSSGGQYTVIPMTPPTFTSDGKGYTVELTGGSGILATEDACFYNGGLLWQTYSFGCNDGGCTAGDRDFNDLFVLITAIRKG
jgi:hypothetical protein